MKNRIRQLINLDNVVEGTSFSSSVGEFAQLTGSNVNIGNIYGTSANIDNLSGSLFSSSVYSGSDAHFTSLYGSNNLFETASISDLTSSLSKSAIFSSSYANISDLTGSTIKSTTISGSSGNYNTINVGDSTNRLTIEPDGTLGLSGSPTCWNDLMVMASNIKVNGTAGSDPPAYTKIAYDATRGTDWSGLFAYAFPYEANSWRDAIFIAQLPHDYKVGSTIYPHLHCRLNANDLNQVGKNLLLEFEYIWSNINETPKHNSATDNTNIHTWNYTTTSASIDSDNLVINMPGTHSGITKADAGISSVLYCRFSRIVKQAGWTYPELVGGLVNDDFNGTLFLSFIDIHYEVDSFGSREEFIK